MTPYENEQLSKLKRWLKKPLLSLLIIFFLSLTAVSLGKRVARLKTLDNQKDELNQQTTELKQERSDLKALLEEVRTEEFLEKIARENFGLAEEGEQVVVIAPDLIEVGPDESINNSEQRSNPQKWLRYFLGE